MSMQKFSQILAASQSMRMNIAGEYFRLGSTSYVVTVRFYKGASITDEMLLIDGGTWARIEGGFDGFELINSSSGAQSLDVFIGSGEVGIDRIIGEVSVINGELNRVKALTCFMGYISNSSGAGLYSETQLWNPIGSGKNLILNKVSLITSTAAGAGIARTQTAISVLSGSLCSNKYLYQAAGVAQLRTDSPAAPVASVNLAFVQMPANETSEYVFSEPLIIAPGNGLVARGGSLNSVMTANFQWIEESI